MDRYYKKDGRTFSEEAIYVTLSNLFEYLNRMMAKICRDGFEKGEPVDKLEINIEWKVNDRKIDDIELLKKYPTLLGFSLKALSELIIEKTNRKT